MKITIENPKITRIIYRQEQADENYGSCLWAIFDFDPDRGILNIQSDCGNFAHRWPERGKDFWELCIGMDEDYLLRKLCGKPGVFDAEATVETVKDYLKDAVYYEDEELNRLKIDKAISDLESEFLNYDLSDEPGIAEYILDIWNSDNNMDIDCVWELVAKDYEPCQERIVQIYEEYIVLEIVRISQEANNETVGTI